MKDKEWEDLKFEIIYHKGYIYLLWMIIKAIPHSLYFAFKEAMFQMRIDKELYKIYKNKISKKYNK
jgi:hypothetical protein